jgi:putative protease
MRKKPELLAPAGNFEKLKYAVHYGADAVYLAGQRFGLRAKAGNFSTEELKQAAEYVHARNKKIYVTLNMIPHSKDLEGLDEYISFLKEIKVDGLIVADPGVFMVVKEIAPEINVSVSTQANNTNYRSAEFWYRQGAKRVILARELGREEIREIIEKTPEELEIEIFVHGAMCISYSGRCLISHYLTGRNSNQGDCSHPCRWKYHLKEATRPEETFTIEEGEEGSFLFNSKDLCLIKEIPELIDAGVNSFKIEGRKKSVYYVATVVAMYRKIIDEYWEKDNTFEYSEDYLKELQKVSHRNYTQGFYYGELKPDAQNYSTGSYTRNYDFVGVVTAYDKDTKIATISQRNRILEGDTIEIFSTHGTFFTQKAQHMKNEDGEIIKATPHPTMVYTMPVAQSVEPMDIIRKQR